MNSEKEPALADAGMLSAPTSSGDPSGRRRARLEAGEALEPAAPPAAESVDPAGPHGLEESRPGKSAQAAPVGPGDEVSTYAAGPLVQRAAANPVSAADRSPAQPRDPPSPAAAVHDRLEMEQTSPGTATTRGGGRQSPRKISRVSRRRGSRAAVGLAGERRLFLGSGARAS